MKFVLITLIFVIVLFLYLHIFFHIKTSNDLEVYECETPDKDKLEEICGLRQPFLITKTIFMNCVILIILKNIIHRLILK